MSLMMYTNYLLSLWLWCALCSARVPWLWDKMCTKWCVQFYTDSNDSFIVDAKCSLMVYIVYWTTESCDAVTRTRLHCQCAVNQADGGMRSGTILSKLWCNTRMHHKYQNHNLYNWMVIMFVDSIKPSKTILGVCVCDIGGSLPRHCQSHDGHINDRV